MTQNFALGAGVSVEGAAITAYKSADESVTNSTALQDDNELVFAMEANGVYAFDFHISYEAQDDPGIRIALNGPAGLTWVEATVDVHRHEALEAQTKRITAYETAVLFTFTDTQEGWMIIRGTVSNGANAGNLVLRWAQETSDATATTIRRGSWLVAHKVA